MVEKRNIQAATERNGRYSEKHRRHFRIADITIEVQSDLPIHDNTFHPKFKAFETTGLARDTVIFRHHFSTPPLDASKPGRQLLHSPPWRVYRMGHRWIYVCSGSRDTNRQASQVAVLSEKFRINRFYNDERKRKLFQEGGVATLSMMPTDQLLLAQVLAQRQGCYFHAAGMVYRDAGFLFMGHSGAGKSTLVRMLQDQSDILCDDRIILRRHAKEYRIHGTWSHGDISYISPEAAPLKGILFLEKSGASRLEPAMDFRRAIRKLLSFLVRPLPSKDWWERSISLIGDLALEVPCHVLHFSQNPGLARTLDRLFCEDR